MQSLIFSKNESLDFKVNKFIYKMSLDLDEQIANLKKQLAKLEEKKTDKTIVQETYNFFIDNYQITPELKTINFLKPEEKHYIIDGNIQSGKTKTLISFCVASLVFKQKVVIIVRNFKEDCVQLVNSINAINKVHNVCVLIMKLKAAKTCTNGCLRSIVMFWF